MKYFKLILFYSILVWSCGNTDKKSPIVSRVNPDDKTIHTAVNYTANDSLMDSRRAGYRAALLKGERSKRSFTDVKYKNTLQLLQKMYKQAKKHQWGAGELQDKTRKLKSENAGGVLDLTVIRTNMDAANINRFVLFIKDSADQQEVFRKTFAAAMPYLSAINSKWWNIETIAIDKKMRPPFYVYVQDTIVREQYKFLITPR